VNPGESTKGVLLPLAIAYQSRFRIGIIGNLVVVLASGSGEAELIGGRGIEN